MAKGFPKPGGVEDSYLVQFQIGNFKDYGIPRTEQYVHLEVEAAKPKTSEIPQ